MMRAEPLATKIKDEVRNSVKEFEKARNAKPKLVALLIGKDPISRTYVDLKQRDCAEVGIASEVFDLSDRSPEGIIEKIEALNSDVSVHAIIPQMPFDGRIEEEEVFATLSPRKDVDGLTPERLGKLVRKEYSLTGSLLPCTPKGIVMLLQYYRVKIEAADVAIVGRSVLVSEPLRKLLQDLNATVTCYHTKSKGINERLKDADIVIAAAGRPPEIYGESGFRLGGDMVSEGSTVVSVGTRRHPTSGEMLFDVDTKALKGRCAFLTPNTGGVGVMTRAALLQNTLIAANAA